MSIRHGISARLRSLVRRRATEARLDEEVRFHIDMETEANMQRGMDRDEARRRAMAAFGGVERHKEAHRDGRGMRWLGDIASDVRGATRSLVRARAFTAVAVMTLALGIGSTVAVFTLLDRVVLRPLPYPNADRLVDIGTRWPGIGPDARYGISPGNYFYFRHASRTLGDLGLYTVDGLTLTGSDEGAERVPAAMITSSLFHVLGARAVRGRLLDSTDDRSRIVGGDAVMPGPAAPAVVLSYEFWVRRFGADPGIVGRSIELGGKAVPVVGVLQRGFGLPDEQVDVWLALGLNPAAPATNWHTFGAIGKLGPTSSLESARREFASFSRRAVELFKSAYTPAFMKRTGFRFDPVSLRDQVVGPVSKALWVLLGSVALVLVIACFNVANLFLVRAENRRREMAVRVALGAGRTRIARTVLVETLLLTAVAGLAGYGIAVWGVHLVVGVASAWIPRVREVQLGWESVAATAAVSLLAGAGFGLIAFARAGADTALLRGGGRGVTLARHQHVVRRALVASQMALALVLLTAAGLMMRSVIRLQNVDPGVRTSGVLAVDLALPRARYLQYAATATFYRTLAERLEALPSVREAAFTDVVPLQDRGGCNAVFVESKPETRDEPPCVGVSFVAPGFFHAMGIPVMGRAPVWSDVQSQNGSVVVSHALAEHLWPGENPIGQGIRGNGWTQPFYRVVGVAGDVRYDGLNAPPTEMVYFPLIPMDGAPLWSPARAGTIVVYTGTDHPEQVATGVRRTIAGLDPSVPVAGISTLRQVVRQSAARAYFTLVLLGISAGMALLLSAVSLYGVISYIVTRRAGEIGIRMALGAQRQQVTRGVMLDSLRVALVGLVVGAVGALLATRLLQSLLFGVRASDPVALLGAAALLAAVAAVASYLPARRAARVDPVTALRAE